MLLTAAENRFIYCADCRERTDDGVMVFFLSSAIVLCPSCVEATILALESWLEDVAEAAD